MRPVFAAIFAVSMMTGTILSGPAFADEAERIEASQRYLALPAVQNMMEEMFGPEALSNQIAASMPGITLTDSQKTRLGELTGSVLQEVRPDLEDSMITATAKHFTLPEIEALIAFYSSEHGGSVMAKMQPYMQDAMSGVMPQLMQKMQAIGPKIGEILQNP